jgi:hypothetical protein
MCVVVVVVVVIACSVSDKAEGCTTRETWLDTRQGGKEFPLLENVQSGSGAQ